MNIRRTDGRVLLNLSADTLRSASLQGADLQDADLQGADMQGADLQGADLQDADLRGANLRGANLQGANLKYADLQDADLQYANTQDAKLQYANLQGANLQGADKACDGNFVILSNLAEYGSLLAFITANGEVRIQIGCLRCSWDNAMEHWKYRKDRAKSRLALEMVKVWATGY